MQNKERILTAAKEKDRVMYKGRPMKVRLLNGNHENQNVLYRCAADIKRPWIQPRLPYSAMISITIDGENKVFHDKTRFKQYLSSKSALQKVLEGKL